MAKSPSLELDFFGMEKRSTAPVFQRRRSFRGSYTRCYIEDESGGGEERSGMAFGIEEINIVCCNCSSSIANSDPKLRAPMTIFYNGVVSVFDVSPRKAQNILKTADEFLPSNLESNSKPERNLLESLNGDLPIKEEFSAKVSGKTKGKVTE
ncbi:hypothetical protein SASPL_115977 [Salvia splendens]|uniref:Tify domain-containing protein n=1 Tax=Salvia splendens TaxID=180675 RepID=A0A8X8Y9C0_SALSN|nr:hypothetical protein SASPL_115977 [Salvia splendens]